MALDKKGYGIRVGFYKERFDDPDKIGFLTGTNFKSKQDAIDFILKYGSVGDECWLDDEFDKSNHFGGDIRCNSRGYKYIYTGSDYHTGKKINFYSSSYLKKYKGGKNNG